MSAEDVSNFESLLSNPDVQEITGNINPESIERKTSVASNCDVFTRPYTALSQDPQYTFVIHNEAQKQLPDIINNTVEKVVGLESPDEAFKERYHRKRNIGIVFSGGPAPGGHNVIAGLYDAAKKVNPDTKVYGFLLGPDGIIENEAILLNDSLIDKYRNIGGFTLIKTGRTKIDTEEKLAMAVETCKTLKLNALVIVGGDDSNTNAAFLAQEMLEDGVQVIGVPKTIDGDIQVRDANGKVLCAMSFGFHTAARSFANSIGNLCTDSSSDVKYWHICKVMGRVASHLALEVALQTMSVLPLLY